MTPAQKQAFGFAHVEAFALMKYADEHGAIIESIWNSRDGVTPETVLALDGKTHLSHVEWKRDVYAPFHPHAGLKVGDRVFLDMTPKRAIDIAQKRLAKYPQGDEDRAEILASLVESLMEDPDIAVVDEGLLLHLRRHFPRPINLLGAKAS